MISPKNAIKKELAERKNQALRQFDISKFLFPEQLAFVNDLSPYSTACCSRRAGKTECIVYDLIREAVTKPGITALYLTLSRSNAKKLVWSKLLELNRKHGLEGDANINELSITFPNKSVIYLSGAKDAASIQKFRGLSLSLAYIDEAQSFGSFIKELVDDVISKALFDHNGRLKLTGTPSPVPAGYFFDVVHSKEWSHHAWTMHQNPFLIQKGNKLSVEDLIDQDCARKGVSRDDPSIQRECFGKWVTDLNSLVLRYDNYLNHYDNLPQSQFPMQTVIGIDTGFVDSDSISVLGYFDDCANCFLIEEIVQPKQGWEALSTQIRALEARYKPLKVVVDPANGALKWAQDVNSRYNLAIEVAAKSQKLEFLEYLSDALRTGKFLAPRTSVFAQDCMKLEWAYDPKTQKRKVSDLFHSDAIDSTLYAFRAAQFWLFKPSVSRPSQGSPEYYQAEAKRMEEEAIAAYHRKNDPNHFDDSEF
jgi:hypothetical protein